MSGAARYRVAAVPGLYLLRVDGSVCAYLRVGDHMYAGAGDTVIEAVSDAFGLAWPDRTVPMDVVMALPTFDQVAPLAATS